MTMDKRHSVSGTFVFLVLGVFALFSMLLVLLGAQAYRSGVERTTGNGQARVLQAFVRNAVRADDEDGVIQVKEIDGLPVITFVSELDGERYVKYVYCYEGELCELFTAEEYGFTPDSGERICAVGSFQPTVEDGLMTIDMTSENGEPCTVSIALRGGR